MFTLNSTEHHAVAAEAYGICSYDSNAMKSPNPNSGFYKADTSRTLDLNGGSPACNQGGVAVVEVAEPTVYNGENVTSPLNKTNPQPGDPCHTLGTDTRNYVADATYCPEIAHTLSARHDGSPQPDKGSGAEVIAAGFSFGQSAKARSIGFQEEVSPTLRGGEGGNQKPCVLDATAGADLYNGSITGDVAATLGANTGQSANHAGPSVVTMRGNGDGKTVCTLTGDHQNRVTDYTAVVTSYQETTGTLSPGAHPGSYNGQDAYNDMLVAGTFQNTGQGWWNESDVGATVRTPCGGDSTKANLVAAVDCRNGTENPDTNGTLQTKPSGGTSLNLNNVVRTGKGGDAIMSVVRRLTPLE